MKRWMFLMTMMMVVSIGANGVPVQANCTKPIPEIYNQVSPAVVLITTFSIDPFKLTDRLITSIGSGFIFSPEGLILTNSHVVFGRSAIAVTLDDGQSLPARLMGADPILDLAVIQIPAPKNGLPVATLGDSAEIQIGQEAIAIGNPLGLEQTLTRGVVSGVNRILPISPMSLMLPLIQTDAAINPGNSGGPLLDRCGTVIGINTAGFMGAENIGFAVPINLARSVLPQLIEQGRVIRPWVGIRGKLVHKKEFGQIFTLPIADGFLVETVEPGSPAAQAGIRGGSFPIKIAGEEFLIGGDIVVSANDKPLSDPKNYESLIKSLKIGDKIGLKIFREGKQIPVEIVIVERPILPWDMPEGN